MFQQFTKQGTPCDFARYENTVPPVIPPAIKTGYPLGHRTGTAQDKTGYPPTPAALRIHSESTGTGTGGTAKARAANCVPPLQSTELPLFAPFAGTPYPYPRHKKTPAEAGACEGLVGSTNVPAP